MGGGGGGGLKVRAPLCFPPLLLAMCWTIINNHQSVVANLVLQSYMHVWCGGSLGLDELPL